MPYSCATFSIRSISGWKYLRASGSAAVSRASWVAAKPGIDREHRHLGLRQLGRRFGNEPVLRDLAGAISRQVRRDEPAGDRRDADHSAPVALDHARQDVVHEQHRGADVDRLGAPPFVGIDLPDRAERPRDAGVVDEEVDRPEQLLGLRHRMLDRGRVGHVAAYSRRRARRRRGSHCATSSSCASDRASSATAAPSAANRSAMARPNPRPAPVTSATCPSKSPCCPQSHEGYRAPERVSITSVSEKLERAKGFEPSTPTLARLCSTPELRPLTAARKQARSGGRRRLASGPGSARRKPCAPSQSLARR